MNLNLYRFLPRSISQTLLLALPHPRTRTVIEKNHSDRVSWHNSPLKILVGFQIALYIVFLDVCMIQMYLISWILLNIVSLDTVVSLATIITTLVQSISGKDGQIWYKYTINWINSILISGGIFYRAAWNQGIGVYDDAFPIKSPSLTYSSIVFHFLKTHKDVV